MSFANIISLVPATSSSKRPWAKDAACQGQPFEVFFPEEVDEKTGAPHTAQSWRVAQAPAKIICSACKVREQCLLLALETHEQFGVWGGLTTEERYQVLRHPNWLRKQREKAQMEAEANGQTTG